MLYNPDTVYGQILKLQELIHTISVQLQYNITKAGKLVLCLA